jgi:N,N'-diacetyllegionaminate synthase
MSEIYLIAEVGLAHDGSLGLARAYIDALAKTGVDAVKFQAHIAEAESSIHEPFRVDFSFQDETRMDYWRRTAFDIHQWAQLKHHCESLDMDFIASAFSNAAVDLLESIGVKKYKVGSGDVNNLLLLNRLSETGKPVILSSGMSSIEELDDSIRFLKSKKVQLSLLQCTSMYPTRPGKWGLNMMNYYRSRYEIPIGFSDHSGKVFSCLSAASQGAEILEFHVVFHKDMFGVDTSSSVTIEEVKLLVAGAREIRFDLQNPVNKNLLTDFVSVKAIFEKSLAVNRALPAGHVITFHDLEGKKPSGLGIPARYYETVLGRRIVRDMEQWAFLNEDDLA